MQIEKDVWEAVIEGLDGIKLTHNNSLSQDLSIHHKCYFHSDPAS